MREASTTEALMTDPTTPEGAAYWQQRHDNQEALERMDEPTNLDLVTDHPFTPATFTDAWPGICGYEVDGLPCGYSRAEHEEARP